MAMAMATVKVKLLAIWTAFDWLSMNVVVATL